MKKFLLIVVFASLLSSFAYCMEKSSGSSGEPKKVLQGSWLKDLLEKKQKGIDGNKDPNCLYREYGIEAYLLPDREIGIYIDLESFESGDNREKGGDFLKKVDCPVTVRCFSFGGWLGASGAHETVAEILRCLCKISVFELWGAGAASSQDGEWPVWESFLGNEMGCCLRDKEYEALAKKHNFKMLENFLVVPFEEKEFEANKEVFSQKYIEKWRNFFKEKSKELPEEYRRKIFNKGFKFWWLKELMDREFEGEKINTGNGCDLGKGGRQISNEAFCTLIKKGISRTEKPVFIVKRHEIAVYVLSTGVVGVLINGSRFAKGGVARQEMVDFLKSIRGLVEVHCFGPECFFEKNSECLDSAVLKVTDIEEIVTILPKIKKFVLWGLGQDYDLRFCISRDFMDNDLWFGANVNEARSRFLYTLNAHGLWEGESYFMFSFNPVLWRFIFENSHQNGVFVKWKNFFEDRLRELPEEYQKIVNAGFFQMSKKKHSPQDFV